MKDAHQTSTQPGPGAMSEYGARCAGGRPPGATTTYWIMECPGCLRSFRTELDGPYAAGSVHLPHAKAAYRVRLRDVKEVLWLSHAV